MFTRFWPISRFSAGWKFRSESLHAILSAYSAINKCDLAETIVKLHLCRPYIQQTLEKESIENLPQIFNSLLDLVPTYLGPLQSILAGRCRNMAPIAGYDFISRSVFPELISGLQTHLPGLFIPGADCGDFRKRYELALDFLTQLEHQCSSQQSVQRLRATHRKLDSSEPFLQIFWYFLKFFCRFLQ